LVENVFNEKLDFLETKIIILIIALSIYLILSINFYQSAFALNPIQNKTPIDQNLTTSSSSSINSNLSATMGLVPYPNVTSQNMDALEQAQIFSPPRIEKVTDRVYSAIGYGPSNIMMINGDDGIIIIDTGSSIVQAKTVLHEFRNITAKPIVAVIYANSHIDHTGGAGIFVEDGLKSGKKVDVIAQGAFLDNYYASLGMLAPQRSIANIFWGGVLLPTNGSDAVISNGIGPAWISGNRSFVKPAILFNETFATNIAGVKINLVHAPGETPDNLIVWLPEERVLFPGDDVYKAFPDLGPITGSATQRNVPQWIDSLDKMRSLNASYLVPSHTETVSGSKNVTDILTSYRDAIAYLYQQTVRYINKGLSPDELAQAITLPQYLRDHPWLQERYGQLSWSVRGIYSSLVGWNTGDATWLNPVTPEERGNKIVQSMGGVNRTISLIQASIKDGDYKWAAELATYVLNAYPDNIEAKLLKAESLRIMGWENPTSGGRNWYLTQANILDVNINATTMLNKSKNNNVIEQAIATVPVKDLLSLLQYRLNPLKSENTTATIGIYMNDTKEGYTLEIRRAVVEFKTSFPTKYDVALYTNSDILKKILLGNLTLQKAVDSGIAKIDGGKVVELRNLAGVFDYRLKTPVYGITGAN